MRKIASADVCVVALGWNTPYPEEVYGCFPSKIVDYLAASRPILAIVPAMSFVDELVEDSGCGVAVNSRDVASIRAGLDQLRSPTARARMIERGRALSEQLQSDDWMKTLLQRLVIGVRPGEVPDRLCYRLPEPVPSPEPVRSPELAQSPDPRQTPEEDSTPYSPSSDAPTTGQEEPDPRVAVQA